MQKDESIMDLIARTKHVVKFLKDIGAHEPVLRCPGSDDGLSSGDLLTLANEFSLIFDAAQELSVEVSELREAVDKRKENYELFELRTENRVLKVVMEKLISALSRSSE